MKRNLWYLIITVVLILGTFVATLASGNSPVLGLDLQGGIEVRLQPVGKAKSNDVLDKAVDIIRNRVNGLGVAETEVKRDGGQIVVDLPGVKDRDKARRLVGKTAELRFRPVLALGAMPTKTPTSSSTASTSSTSSTASTSSTSAPPASGPGKSVAAPAAATTSTTTAAAPTPAPAADPAADPATTATTVAPQAPTVTPEAQDKRNAVVNLPGRDGQVLYQLGPTALTGRLVTSATARFESGSGQWSVSVNFNGLGHQKFDALAAASISKPAPQNAVAIVLDGIVQSAPTFQEASYPNGVSISGSFSQSDAEDLATVLKFGSLPVQLKELTTTSISPTLGSDQLDAGLLAGGIGLILVALYMLVFYRILGVVVIAGLILAGSAIYTMITYLGQSIGLTLTLAGVVGLIVSVGITVDSYIVYFERLKDEIRTGRTVRSSVDRGFVRSFKTILAADLVSLIAAAILYWRAVGSVAQFAFLLGLSTILDLLISYFFMHPLVQQMARSAGLVGTKKVGMAAGLDTPEATV
ncbi:MAG: protein translocase subunit SecD [Acidimicrobiia bacterium]|nr:protein translocase subunit SecD [Acidimicrobiia bacterium]